jgi:hypothetical protein
MAKQRRSKKSPPLDAGFTVGVPKDQLPIDLRHFRINECDSAWVRVDAPLVPGCSVALLYRNKRFNQ